MAERDNSQGQNIDFSGKNMDIDVQKSASLKAVGRGTRGTPIKRKDTRITEEGDQGVAGVLDEEYKKQWDTARRRIKKVAIGAAVAGIAAKAKKKSYLARQAAREEEARRQEEEYKRREALSGQGVGKEKEEKPAADQEKEEKEEVPEFGEVPEEEGEGEGAGEEGEGEALPLPEGEVEGEGAGEEEEGEDIMDRIKKAAEERGKKEIKKRRKEAEFQRRLKELRQPEKIAPKKPAKIKVPAKLRPRAAVPKAGPAAGAAGRAAGGAGRAAGSALARAGAAIVAGGGLVALIIAIIILVIILVVVIVFYVKAQKDCDGTASGQAFCSVFKTPGGMGYGNLGGSSYGSSGETGEPNGWQANLVAGGSQLNEADPQLIDFINCIHSGFPADTNAWQVTSLSDGAGLATCQGNNWTDPACAHGQWSCHYGGHNCNQSVAFDVQPVDSTKRNKIGDQIYVRLRAEASLCGTQMNLDAGFLNETTSANHIHLSIKDAECDCAENLTPP
ncbi:MAG: hypothetical protein PHW01_01720 [Patescibacteria group bacterium]|nr:hypothetical protein [Patescibacteria group bacterium]